MELPEKNPEDGMVLENQDGKFGFPGVGFLWMEVVKFCGHFVELFG